MLGLEDEEIWTGRGGGGRGTRGGGRRENKLGSEDMGLGT